MWSTPYLGARNHIGIILHQSEGRYRRGLRKVRVDRNSLSLEHFSEQQIKQDGLA
jgi:hypothetical protein